MKIVLAYSGGLDTAVALKWLQQRYGAEVIAFCADLGQPEDFADIRRRAEAVGASQVLIEDLRETYLREHVFPALRAGAAYEGRYLMAAPLGRPLIARRLVEIAHRENADAVAHGSTGKGNDQVRFYGGVVAHDPDLRILAPAIEWELKSRSDEIRYAREHGIEIPVGPERPYSKDGSIWGTSTECGILDDYRVAPPEHAYQLTLSPRDAGDTPAELTITFERGTPTHLDGVALGPVALVGELNRRGGAAGIGRVDMVENSLLGVKSRAVYESPGGAILHFAHQELESIVLDREVLHCQTPLSQKYAELVYYGQWFSPLRVALQTFFDHTQETVSGKIGLSLYKGNMTVISRESEHALYDFNLSAHGDDDRFDHPAGVGFAYVWSMHARLAAKRRQRKTG